jgi:hypothetical protein
MPKRKTRRDPLLSRDDIVLTLTEARSIMERQLSGAPEYVRGYQDGISVAIEVVRALSTMERVIDDREIQRR